MEVFEYLYSLLLRYYFECCIGGLSCVIECGVKFVDFFLRFLVFSIGLIFLELVLVNIVFIVMYSWVYVVIMMIVVICYMWFIFLLMEW